MKKTLAEIGLDAYISSIGSGPRRWEAVAKAIAEECALLCDRRAERYATGFKYTDPMKTQAVTAAEVEAEEIANAIRALANGGGNG